MIRCVTPAEVAVRFGCRSGGAMRIMRAAGGFFVSTTKLRALPSQIDRWEQATLALQPLPHDTVGDVCYFIADGDAVKIGFSTNFPRRFSALQVESARPLRVLALFAGGDATEAYFHGRFRDLRIHNEWFRLEEPILALLRERAA